MNKKNAVFIAILITFSVGAFIFSHLYDFETSEVINTIDVRQHGLMLYFILTGLSLLPCFALGAGRVNALWGFFPPALLSIEMYILLLLNLSKAKTFQEQSISSFNPISIGLALISGFFGILIVYVSSQIFSKIFNAAQSAEGKSKTNGRVVDETNDKNKEKPIIDNGENINTQEQKDSKST